MTRPRVRSQAGQEVELPSFAFATHRDPLDAHAVNAVACGISTRKYARSLDTLPDEVAERSTSKSAVSRRYVVMTTTQLTRWLTTPLGDRHFPIVLIDGIVLGDHTVVSALGIDTEGKKQVLGLRERKLPRQVDTAKGDCTGGFSLGKNVRGGTRPRLSCGRSWL